MHDSLRCALQAHFTRTHIVGDMTTDQRNVLTTASRLLQVRFGLRCSCRRLVDKTAAVHPACSHVCVSHEDIHISSRSPAGGAVCADVSMVYSSACLPIAWVHLLDCVCSLMPPSTQ